MPSSYDYAIIKIVPLVERGEFINAGVILFCRTQRFLAAQVELHEARLLALIPAICNGHGPIGQLDMPERFHWLVAPRSTIIQTSDVHCGLCSDPTQALEHLMATMVRLA